MADLEVTMNHPHFPQGTEIDIDGVGTVKNGESVSITQEMQDNWQAANEGIDMQKSLAQNGVLEFSGKSELEDAPQQLEDIDPEAQAARNDAPAAEDAPTVEAASTRSTKKTGGEK